MRYRPWDEEDIDKLKELCKNKASIEDICSTLDRSRVSVMSQIGRLGKDSEPSLSTKEPALSVLEVETPRTRRNIIEKAAINFLDMRVKDGDYSQVWDSIQDFQGALEEKSIEQNLVNIRIKTNKWIGVAFQGDLHIGNMATDYKTMRKHGAMIAKTDDLYLILNGDYCDNYIPSSHVAGMFEALFPPAIQKNLAKDYIQMLKSKVLALISGCHDLWGMKAADFDLTEYLAKHGEAAYLGNGGIINLTVGKVTYKLSMRHKYRFNSADNPTSTVKKMFEKSGGFDVGVISHNHIACIEECTKEGLDGNLKRLFIRAGTYKVHDKYGSEMGFGKSDISVPVVLFSPDRRDIRGFQSLEEGIQFLAYLNDK